ncbi:MAG: VWA domain-containing protein [Actinomycetota bacterium]|nr:VWA domain-containing protein [Actinomycetota bacterium]
MRVRYNRWSGSQDPFPADVSPDAVLEEISEDLLSGYDADAALQRLLRRGLGQRQGRVMGLDDLRQRIEQARQRELGRMGLEGPLQQVAQRLAEIESLERTALQLADDPAQADRHGEQLDALPTDPAARLSALNDYQWYDEGAAAAFRELLEQLRRDVAEATFGRLASALGSLSAEDLQRTQDLLADVNAMVAKRERGEDVTADFAAFKQRYADLMAGLANPETLDDLLEELARRMAAMSQMMAGLDADQRAQLAQLSSELLADLDLSFQTEQLTRSLQRLYPELGWDESVSGAMPGGQESGSLPATVDWVEHLRSYEDLGAALRQDYPGARLEDVDEDALRRALGDDAVHDLRALREVERVLEEAGAASRQQGRLELTPRGIRKLGERSLARIYDRAVTGAPGSHRASGSGGDGELTGATRPYRFGDPFRLDVGRTIGNALRRGTSSTPATSSAAPPAPSRVRLRPDDFELAEAERRVRAATVLLLDMSFSMPLRGNWVPAKRLALALHSLIDGSFPEDRFDVVGFSDYARRVQPRDLFATGWERVQGTNMQHAFMLARRLLGAHPDAEQQVIMVTDGEPTAHLEGDTPSFEWPPHPRTLQLTMMEARRLTGSGTTLNVFLLDHEPGAAAFIEHMVSSVGGRIFYPDLDDLGSVVVHDFLHRRSH